MNVKRLPHLSLLAATALALGVIAAHPAGAAETGQPMPMDSQSSLSTFNKLDTNHDGYVDRNEAKRLNGLSEIFDQADTNHDGKLSKEEFARIQSN